MLRGAAHRAFKQVGDVPLKNRVRLEADCVLEAFGFDKVIQIRQGERGIAAKVPPLQFAP